MSSSSTLRDRSTFRLVGILAVLALVLAACSGAEEDTGTDSEGTEAAGEEAGDATEAAAGTEAAAADGEMPEFDLSGESIQIVFGDASAQSVGNLLMLEDLIEWGADAEQITLTTATGLSALVAGQADFAAGQGADEAVLGLATGNDITAIGAPDSANSYVVISTDEVNDISELEGRRVATSGPGGFNTALMSVALQRNGLSEDDVELLTIGGSPERSAALLAGQVDATTIFYADWNQVEAQSDNLQLLARMDELVPNIPDLYYYGMSSYWEENPEVAQAVACANLNANARLSSDKEFFIELAQEAIPGSDPEVLSETYDELLALGNWPTEPDEIMNVEGLDSLVELMIETGDLDEEIDTSGLVDLTYLEQAVEMGCGATS